MKDPVRLLTDGSAHVRDLLRSAAEDAPSRGQLDHLAARLAPTVAAPAAGGLVTWLLAGAAVLGGVGVLVVAHGRTAPPKEQPAITAPRPPQSEPAPPAVVITTPEPAPPPAPAPMPRHRIATPEPARPAPPAPPAPRELELLTPAQAALRASDLSRALALADRHASLYPEGMFAEEREAIAIEALHGLGQRDRARVRLTAFITRYPHSGYRARLERELHE